jgi:hypothetical protein
LSLTVQRSAGQANNFVEWSRVKAFIAEVNKLRNGGLTFSLAVGAACAFSLGITGQVLTL